MTSKAKTGVQPSIVEHSAVTFPRFQLFELAIMHWESDDPAIAHDDPVQIVGLTWWPDGWYQPGWVYHVRNLYKPCDGHLPAGHQEDCAESELRKVSIQPFGEGGEFVVLRSA